MLQIQSNTTLLYLDWGLLKNSKMGRNNYFQFKQFKIIQDNSAMKVGTDGVLLGAWAKVSGAKTILDIGTGTGVISLMMAQRSEARVLGIEIEKNAAEEAKENVQHSPWKDRVSIENISLQDFANITSKTFDLVVSNPPFFTNSFKNEIQNRSIARHNDFLSFPDLIKNSVKLMNENGRFSVILPAVAANEFIKLAKLEGLNLVRKTEVKPNVLKNANRFLMEFSKKETALKKDSLIIYNELGTDY